MAMHGKRKKKIERRKKTTRRWAGSLASWLQAARPSRAAEGGY
jgi:hypothetical protein